MPPIGRDLCQIGSKEPQTASSSRSSFASPAPLARSFGGELAALTQEPLLFKGEDFAKPDIRAA